MAPIDVDLADTGIRGYNGQYTKGHKAITKGLCNLMAVCVQQPLISQMTPDNFYLLHHSIFSLNRSAFTL